MASNKPSSAMPKERVQFQKGLSLARFLQDYGSEPQCEQALFNLRWPDGLRCPRYGSDRFCRLSTRRTTFQCNHCKRQISLLAGTLFQATKLPLTTWFLAMYLLSQAKNGISALELGRQLGVNNNTAWLLKHKLMQAMRERDRAILLGCVRKSMALIERPATQPVRRLRYFEPLLREVQRESFPATYWRHLEFNLGRCEDYWQRHPEAAPGRAWPNMEQADQGADPVPVSPLARGQARKDAMMMTTPSRSAGDPIDGGANELSS